jgi:hypothetical protein
MSIWRRAKILEDWKTVIDGFKDTINSWKDTVETWKESAINAIQTINGNITTLQNTVAALAPPQVFTLVGDVATGANVNPVSATGLVFSYAANSKYKIDIFALVSPTASTTGCGFQFDLSSAVTRIALNFYHQLAVAGTLSGGHSIADDASVGVSSGMPANAGVYPVTVDGILITGANAGTAQLRFRSETTAVTTLKANTILLVTKL